MASPDFRPYVDLTIFNADINTIYSDSVTYARTAFPEFNPRVGTIENALLEASSYIASNLVTSINLLPNGLMEGLLKLMGFARIEATPAVGTVTVDVTVNTGLTISAGTVFSYDVFDSLGVLTQFLFETTEDLVIASGNTAGSVQIQAVNASEYPDIPVPQTLTLISTSPYILDVTLTTLNSVGTDTETDTEYFDRAVKYLASLSNALVTSSQLSNYISVTYPTVSRFKVYDLTESANMLFADPDVAGKVTIALCDSNGDAIDSIQKTIIENSIQSRVVAGLVIELYDMQTFNVDVAASIVCEPNYSTAAVSVAVSEAIESYLSIAGWDFSEKIDSKYLTTIAVKVPGVKYVDSMSVEVNGVTSLAVDNGLNVDLLEKGAIPIGSCTTVAV